MNTKQVMQNKKRTIIKVSLAIFAVLLVVIFAVSHIVGEKVEAYVKTELVKYVEERVEGRVVLNNVELTLTGYVAANGLEIYDGNDNPMLKSSAVRVYYKWLDIFGSEAGMATIEEVLIKDCEVFITEKENKELNIDVLLKEDKDSSKENKESPV
ncbi:hypothetical protein LJC10_04220, partial [Selenomonadales bacterium OttesenSCG-928-I06]|nr:hypothetical protein [Selenomonadales bacterium OttesenSCG-928-I06]